MGADIQSACFVASASEVHSAGRTQLAFDVWDANTPPGGGSGAIVVPVTNEGGPDATETVAVKPASGTIQA